MGRLERTTTEGRADVRLILDGTLVRVLLDKKATAISLLVVIGVREDVQKVLLAVKRGAVREVVEIEAGDVVSG